jgi:hypothetical protein
VTAERAARSLNLYLVNELQTVPIHIWNFQHMRERAPRAVTSVSERKLDAFEEKQTIQCTVLFRPTDRRASRTAEKVFGFVRKPWDRGQISQQLSKIANSWSNTEPGLPNGAPMHWVAKKQYLYCVEWGLKAFFTRCLLPRHASGRHWEVRAL